VAVSRFPLSHTTTVYDKRWSPLATTKCLCTVVICRYLSHAPFHFNNTHCVYDIDVSVDGMGVARPGHSLYNTLRDKEVYIFGQQRQLGRYSAGLLAGRFVCSLNRLDRLWGGLPTSQPIVTRGVGLFHCEL